MQIIAFDDTESARTDDFLRQTFKLRARVFQGRLHWNVRVLGGQERDIFDRLQPTYLVALKPDDTVIGCVRLLPAKGPTMLSTVFPNLLHGCTALDLCEYVEASRFCVDTARHRDGGTLHDATRSLFTAMVDWSLQQDYAGIVVVVDLRMERILRRAGWLLSRLGRPQPMGVTSGVAGMLTVSASQMRALRPDDYNMLNLCRAVLNPASQMPNSCALAMAEASQL